MKTLALIFVFISTIAFADPWEIPDIECNDEVCLEYETWTTTDTNKLQIVDNERNEESFVFAKYNWETKKWTFSDDFIEAINKKLTKSQEFRELILKIVREAGIFSLDNPEFDFGDTFVPFWKGIPNSRYNNMLDGDGTEPYSRYPTILPSYSGPCFKDECE